MAQMANTSPASTLSAEDSATRVPIVVNGGTFHFYGGSSILKTTWRAGTVSEEDILSEDCLEQRNPCESDYDYNHEGSGK